MTGEDRVMEQGVDRKVLIRVWTYVCVDEDMTVEVNESVEVGV